MLKSARQAQIRRLVDEQGQITVAELNRLLKVSEATVRRDLEELANQGWIRRTHGGAVKVERARREPPIVQRLSANQEAKQRIGRLAASLVQPGETIFLGSGSTVQCMVPHLRAIPELTVITNSLPVINELAGNDHTELIVIGGMFRQSELSMVGHIAEQAIREFRADRVFMGIRGIDVQHGLTSDYLPEAMTDRAILAIAPQRIIVADHSKFSRVSTVFLAPVTAIDVLVTDTITDPSFVDALRQLNIQVLTCDGDLPGPDARS